jgi:hypothetical protein
MTKRADRISAFFEATLFAGFEADEAVKLFGAPDVELSRINHLLAPMKPEEAQQLFLRQFQACEGGR